MFSKKVMEILLLHQREEFAYWMHFSSIDPFMHLPIQHQEKVLERKINQQNQYVFTNEHRNPFYKLLEH